MVIKNRGRKTGKIYHTSVKLPEIDGDIYCSAGFGVNSDWYRNIMADPRFEILLPDERWAGLAVTGLGVLGE
jgi:hypothetical protein